MQWIYARTMDRITITLSENELDEVIECVANAADRAESVAYNMTGTPKDLPIARPAPRQRVAARIAAGAEGKTSNTFLASNFALRATRHDPVIGKGRTCAAPGLPLGMIARRLQRQRSGWAPMIAPPIFE